MLQTKCVGDDFKMLLTVLPTLITNILYLFSKKFLHKRQAPTFKRCRQHRNSITSIHKSSPTLRHQHHGHQNITWDRAKLNFYLNQVLKPVEVCCRNCLSGCSCFYAKRLGLFSISRKGLNFKTKIWLYSFYHYGYDSMPDVQLLIIEREALK